MSKTPNDKLFNLVKSLNSSERRYFKVYVKGHGLGEDNKYMELFDFIYAQKEFDDQALIKQVYAGDPPTSSRKYQALKSYLYELLLKALQNYDENQNYNILIKRLIGNIEILFDRFQIKDASSELVKAKRIALRKEDFSSSLQLCDWSKKIVLAKKNKDTLGSKIEEINHEIEEYRIKQKNLTDYRDLFYKIMFYINIVISVCTL